MIHHLILFTFFHGKSNQFQLTVNLKFGLIAITTQIHQHFKYFIALLCTLWSHDDTALSMAYKCTVLHLGCHNNIFDYFVDNRKLDANSEEKDLGVLITSNWKSPSQCQQAYAKASKALGELLL